LYSNASRFQQRLATGIYRGHYSTDKAALNEGERVIPCKAGPHRYKVIAKDGKFIRWASSLNG
jgi:hypothetical protein